MDEATIEVTIAYDLKGGRVVLSGMELPLVKAIKKKLDGMKRIKLQVHDEGFIVSPHGVYFAADEQPQYRVGIA